MVRRGWREIIERIVVKGINAYFSAPVSLVLLEDRSAASCIGEAVPWLELHSDVVINVLRCRPCLCYALCFKSCTATA